jgi:hypothetical protein
MAWFDPLLTLVDACSNYHKTGEFDIVDCLAAVAGPAMVARSATTTLQYDGTARRLAPDSAVL